MSTFFVVSKTKMMVLWTIVVLFLLMVLSVNPVHGAVCPPRDLIWPCKCADYFNLIECTNITNDSRLKEIFINLKQELDKQRARPVYDEFKLVQTQLVNIGQKMMMDEDLFSGVSFRRISLSRNNQLRRIEPNVFASSHNVTTEIMIEDNELLGNEHDDNIALFRTLNQFVGLNTLHLTDNGVRFIPKQAFKQKQPALRELFLTDNRIERVEDNAFTALDSLQLINLDGNHISDLSPRSLEMEDTNKNNFLRIFLRSNKLHTETFPPNIFSRLRRKTYLNMNLNNITKIPQNVFQSFFKRGSILSISKNPLKCDCDFKWLLSQGILYNSSNTKKDYQLRDYQCTTDKDDEQIIDEVDFSDFEHCPQSSVIDLSLKACLDQASDQHQEEFCLNGAHSNKQLILLMTNMILIIMVKIIAF